MSISRISGPNNNENWAAHQSHRAEDLREQYEEEHEIEPQYRRAVNPLATVAHCDTCGHRRPLTSLGCCLECYIDNREGVEEIDGTEGV